MSRQRTWALKAHERVRARKKEGLLLQSYNTHCKKGPSLLQRAGTAQGLAFLVSRKEKSDMGCAYASDLATIYGAGDWRRLLNEAQDTGFTNYIVLSRDLLDISAWLRRFAQVELADQGDE